MITTWSPLQYQPLLIVHTCTAALHNVKCDLKLYHCNHDPVEDFH